MVAVLTEGTLTLTGLRHLPASDSHVSEATDVIIARHAQVAKLIGYGRWQDERHIVVV
jgi:hypothetical protein